MMHKLMEYLCNELEDLERKAEKGKLSMTEIEFADKLLNMKKNLLKAEEMYEDSEYSAAMDGRSYARGGMRGGYTRRGSRRGGANQYGSYSMEGGYSRNADMVQELREMMQDAPDEKTRQEFSRFISRMENM